MVPLVTGVDLGRLASYNPTGATTLLSRPRSSICNYTRPRLRPLVKGVGAGGGGGFSSGYLHYESRQSFSTIVSSFLDTMA
jgi:hypothetical protein